MKNQNLQHKLSAYQKIARGLKNPTVTAIAKAAPVMGAAFILPVVESAGQTVHHKILVGASIFNHQLASSTTFTLKIKNNANLTIGTLNIYGSDEFASFVGGTLHVEAANDNFVKKFTLGDRIDNQTFGTNGVDKLVDSGAADEWSGTGYFAFKFGNNIGWARLTYAGSAQIVIDEYAFVDATELDPANQFFNAGETLLPVELTAFRAQIIENAAQLFWATASEENNAGFEVQRSTDGKNFETLAFVEGHGTTYEAQEYLFDDKTIRQNTTYYYRLKQMDFDGKFEFTDVVTARLEGNTNTGAFYPNPAIGGATKLDYTASTSGKLNVTVYNISGQAVTELVRNVESGSNVLAFDFSALSKGNYFVKLENGSDRQYQKLVIE